MPSNSSLMTAQVLAVFIEDIAARGGKVTDMYGDERRLFARSVLPLVEEVQPGDGIKGGVALKARRGEVCMHPYLCRLICKNGAIVSKTLGSRTLENVFSLEADRATQVIREGIEACSSKELFADSIRKIRNSRRVQASETEVAATLAVAKRQRERRLESLPTELQIFRFLQGNAASRDIAARFERDADRSRYGLANAVTSVARDIKSSELKWDLEELGGAILLGMGPKNPIDGELEAALPPRRLVEVG